MWRVHRFPPAIHRKPDSTGPDKKFTKSRRTVVIFVSLKSHFSVDYKFRKNIAQVFLSPQYLFARITSGNSADQRTTDPLFLISFSRKISKPGRNTPKEFRGLPIHRQKRMEKKSRGESNAARGIFREEFLPEGLL